jgi:hypothetical protein
VWSTSPSYDVHTLHNGIDPSRGSGAVEATRFFSSSRRIRYFPAIGEYHSQHNSDPLTSKSIDLLRFKQKNIRAIFSRSALTNGLTFSPGPQGHGRAQAPYSHSLNNAVNTSAASAFFFFQGGSPAFFLFPALRHVKRRREPADHYCPN